jgi:hypothetical protein
LDKSNCVHGGIARLRTAEGEIWDNHRLPLSNRAEKKYRKSSAFGVAWPVNSPYHCLSLPWSAHA